MSFLYYVFGAYLLVINLDGLLMMRTDKKRAREGRRRIPEATLFTIAALGGGIGVLIGMYAFRHKTQHLSFVLGVPLIIIFETAVLFVMLYMALNS